MLYQKDAHQYRKKIRRKQRLQRAKGAFLISLSLSCMLYAIPCFATSIWDQDSASKSVPTAFSSDVADSAYVGASEEGADETPVYDVSGLLVSETTGPGLLEDEEAVKSAKLRAQAVSVATAERNARLHPTQYTEPVAAPSGNADLTLACIAALVSLVCGIFGVRTMFKARTLRGRAIAAAYDSALRAF